MHLVGQGSQPQRGCGNTAQLQRRGALTLSLFRGSGGQMVKRSRAQKKHAPVLLTYAMGQ